MMTHLATLRRRWGEVCQHVIRIISNILAATQSKHEVLEGMFENLGVQEEMTRLRSSREGGREVNACESDTSRILPTAATTTSGNF